VAIVGAGLAGLACAQALSEAGCAVRLFEKSRGAAGRMSARHGDGWQCDHGAQYFTARDPEFRAEVARWIEAGAAQRWHPRLRAFEPGGLVRVPDETLERFVGTPGMTAPALRLARCLPLEADCTIDVLARDAGGWRLHCAERGWVEGVHQAVLLAVPAPQAATLLSRAGDAEGRSPGSDVSRGVGAARGGEGLSDSHSAHPGAIAAVAGLAALARSVPMRACWALMLRYATPLALDFDAAFVNEGPLRWLARNLSKPGRSGAETWLLHANSEWSEANYEQSVRRVAQELIETFARIGGVAPQAWTAHRWRHADTAHPLVAGSAWRVEAGLGLCGDWLAGGKVEGAWRSGRALAAAVRRDLASLR